MHNIVFLDRESLDTSLRSPAFPHTWQDYPASRPADVLTRLAEASIVVTNKVPLRATELASLPKLKMIAVAATGTDILDLEACKAYGITVSNIRQYATTTLPEHVFALILALRRNLIAYHNDVNAGRWQNAPQFCFLDHPIRDLAGSRLGIIGYGALGQAVARLGQAFGMEVCVSTRSPIQKTSEDISKDASVQALPLEQLLATADVITLHLPLSAATRHFISTPQLAQMKKTALLINTARGGLVDEAALTTALQEGVIAGAGFDVLSKEPPPADHPLLQLRLPNFILTPHVAWASQEAMQTLADQLIDNIEAYVAGVPRNVVV